MKRSSARALEETAEFGIKVTQMCLYMAPEPGGVENDATPVIGCRRDGA